MESILYYMSLTRAGENRAPLRHASLCASLQVQPPEKSPSLEIFKTRLDKVLYSLLQVTLLRQEGWTR